MLARTRRAAGASAASAMRCCVCSGDSGRRPVISASPRSRAASIVSVCAASNPSPTAAIFSLIARCVSPVISGLGCNASNQSCAVSATGTGEYFIRLTVAREICALVQYKGMKLQAAADQVIQKELGALGGDGGVIAVAPDGQMAWSFNTSGMYRARIADGQPVTVGIYKDDP